MGNKKPLTSHQLYFGMQAKIGITKHMGGKNATKELIELCKIGRESYVLDVGCGVGKTACYLAKEVGCKVVGVDLYPEMVNKSRERARRKGVLGRAEFRVADAQNLPFKSNTFDAVICESVAAFFEDRQRGVNEFARVAKPKGYIGLNELTWVAEPSKKIVDYMARTMGGNFLNSDGWKNLLKNAGLKEIAAGSQKLNALKQMAGELSWLEPRDYFSAGWNMISMIIKSPEYRRYIFGMGIPPLNISKSMGNGIYVGRK